MSTKGVRGQSVASWAHGVALFGGFDDRFLRFDLVAGRLDSLPAAGRTVLHPWDDRHFVCIEEVLGRRSRTRLTLREFAEPTRAVATNGEWADSRRLIPGHFPTVFVLESGSVATVDYSHEPTQSVVGFVPGVFTVPVPVLEDGSWTADDHTVVAGVAVGRDAGIFFATADGLVVVRDGAVASRAPVPDPWRPAVVDHDPAQRTVIVASWNRWGSLGGPSSDFYLFDEGGSLLASGRAGVLVARATAAAFEAVALDVEDKPIHVELTPAGG